MSKAFKPSNNYSGTSSERTSNMKRSVMYTAVTRSQHANELDKYQATNRDFRLTSCTDVSGNNGSTLVSARDYKTYMDIAIGKRLNNPVLNGAEAYSLNTRFGSFYRKNVSPGIVFSTTYAMNGSAPLPDMSGNGTIAWPNNSQDYTPTGTNQYFSTAEDEDNYKGYVLDPYNMFSESCTLDNTRGKTKLITPNINARWLNSYWHATCGQPLSGFSFPAKVNFGNQETNYNNRMVVNAAPMTKAVNNVSVENTYGAFDDANKRYCGLIENST